MGKRIQVTLLHSAIGRQQDQKKTLKGLGFRRLHQRVVLENTPAVRGMIKRVQHLVAVEAVAEGTVPQPAKRSPSYRVLDSGSKQE